MSHAMSLCHSFLAQVRVCRMNHLKRILERMYKPVVVDLRNVYEPNKMQAIGFDYHGNGRGHQRT
jgi:hypothetical protein